METRLVNDVPQVFHFWKQEYTFRFVQHKASTLSSIPPYISSRYIETLQQPCNKVSIQCWKVAGAARGKSWIALGGCYCNVVWLHVYAAQSEWLTGEMIPAAYRDSRSASVSLLRQRECFWLWRTWMGHCSQLTFLFLYLTYHSHNYAHSIFCSQTLYH